jgi:hypothetical protein
MGANSQILSCSSPAAHTFKEIVSLHQRWLSATFHDLTRNQMWKDHGVGCCRKIAFGWTNVRRPLTLPIVVPKPDPLLPDLLALPNPPTHPTRSPTILKLCTGTYKWSIPGHVNTLFHHLQAQKAWNDWAFLGSISISLVERIGQVSWLVETQRAFC